MIDRGHDLSIVRQAKVLKLARSTVYYEPRPVSAEDCAFRGIVSKAFGALQRFGRQLNRLRDDLVVNEGVQCLPGAATTESYTKAFVGSVRWV